MNFGCTYLLSANPKLIQELHDVLLAFIEKHDFAAEVLVVVLFWTGDFVKLVKRK